MENVKHPESLLLTAFSSRLNLRILLLYYYYYIFPPNLQKGGGGKGGQGAWRPGMKGEKTIKQQKKKKSESEREGKDRGRGPGEGEKDCAIFEKSIVRESYLPRFCGLGSKGRGGFVNGGLL